MSAPRVRLFEGGAEIDVPNGHLRGALAIESDGLRRVRIVLDGQTLAWGRVLRWWRGFAWSLLPRAASLAIVPPIRSIEARRADPSAWAHHFASWLASSHRTWLRPGRWAVTPMADAVAPRAQGLITALDGPRALVETYRLNGSARVLALRAASLASSARVKSWRKHARDGTLPPILLGWIGALDAWVVLDGHDRLSAARLEQARPEAIALYGVRVESWPLPEGDRQRARDESLARYQLAFRNEPRLADRSRDDANARLVGAWTDYAQKRSWTPATYRADLGARFGSEQASLDLPPDVRASLLGDP